MLLPSHAEAQPQVTVELDADNLIRVLADDMVEAPMEMVWDTPVDYEHLSSFIPDMQSSHIISMKNEPLHVMQEGAAKFLGYSFPLNVTFEIQADPPHLVRFHSIAGNLRDMEGFYQMEMKGQHTMLHYEAYFRPDFWFPPLIGPVVMKEEITRQFEGLTSEILKRFSVRKYAEIPAR